MSIQVRGPVLGLMMAAAVLVVGCALMPSVATASEAPERWRRAASELHTPAFRPVELAGFRLSRFVVCGRGTQNPLVEAIYERRGGGYMHLLEGGPTSPARARRWP